MLTTHHGIFGSNSSKLRWQVYSRYKFVLALENANCTDWVTERVFDVLKSGSVPVYLGTDTIDEFLPCKNCIIKASDFADPAALAEHLHYLADNSSAYEEYISWRRSKPLLQTRLAQQLPKYRANLCDALELLYST
jgi:alpha-1,3-fucosyltransferase 10